MEKEKTEEKTGKSSRFLAVFIIILIALIIIFSCVFVSILAGMSNSMTEFSSMDSFTVSPAQADIGEIKIEGPIMDVDKYIKQLNKFNKSEKMKAVIVIINSPGGAVVPSQKIYYKLKRISEKKKIYIMMESLCASGGYYIAIAGDELWAYPGTLTGSIGVIAQFLNTEELYSKVGLKFNVIKSGKYKDVGSPLREMNEADRELLQQMIDDTYSEFYKVVEQERLDAVLKKLKEKDPSAAKEEAVKIIKENTDGRILTAPRAERLGMIDNIGDYDDLVEHIKKVHDLKKPKISRKKKKPEILQLFEEFSQTMRYRLSGARSEIQVRYSVL